MKYLKAFKLTLSFLIVINIASAQTIAKTDSEDKIKQGNIKNDVNQLEVDYSGKEINKFPAEVLAMTDLKQLDLSNNNLTELPKEIKSLKYLSVLNVSGNKIYELPSEISRLKFLKEIYLDRVIWQYRLNEVKRLTSARVIFVD